MAETKYGKYIVKEPLGTGEGFRPIFIANGDKHFEGAGFSFRLHYITGPNVMIKEPHRHDFEQYLCFVGNDMNNIKDFGGEIELYLGEEGEKHIINTASIVHVAKGLFHGPLEFKKIHSPVIFLDMILTATYGAKPLR